MTQGVIRHAGETLQNPWAKQLFEQFVQDASLSRAASTVINLVRRNIEGFQLLDRAFHSEEQLTVPAILDVFGGDTSGRRFRVIKNWFSTTRGLNFDGPEADWIRHRAMVHRTLEREPSLWIRNTLAAFLDGIYVRRAKAIKAGVVRANVPLATRSIELAFKYAQWLMHFCRDRGITDLVGIDQAAVDGYATSRPKVYQSLGVFIRFLNRTSHQLNKITLPSKPRARNSLVNKLSLAKRAALVKRWFAATESNDLRNSAIALLSLFYVQRIPEIVQLKRSAIKVVEDESMEIDFGQGLIEIHPDIATVVTRWLDAWTSPSRFVTQENDDHVFPGIQPGRPYRSVPFYRWLKRKHGVNSRQLFSTALHGVIDAGLNDPGTLVSFFGITPSTAIRYWTDSGRDLSSFLFAESVKKLREEGYFVSTDD